MKILNKTYIFFKIIKVSLKNTDIKFAEKERGGFTMVEAISAINSASQVSAPVTSTDKIESKELQETAKSQQSDKVNKTEDENNGKIPLDRLKIRGLVIQYIENLKKTHDYPIVQERLDRWLFLFDVDKFMKKYPNIYSEYDLNTIMYNETINLL